MALAYNSGEISANAAAAQLDTPPQSCGCKADGLSRKSRWYGTQCHVLFFVGSEYSERSYFVETTFQSSAGIRGPLSCAMCQLEPSPDPTNKSLKAFTPLASIYFQR